MLSGTKSEPMSFSRIYTDFREINFEMHLTAPKIPEGAEIISTLILKEVEKRGIPFLRGEILTCVWKQNYETWDFSLFVPENEITFEDIPCLNHNPAVKLS